MSAVTTTLKPKADRKLTVMPKPLMSFPALYLDVYVQADQYETPLFAAMFSRALCRKAETLDKADLVVFGGGSDIDPQIYGGVPVHDTVSFNPSRDSADINLYLEATAKGIPLMGVCRGAQLIWALSGGGMYQDVDGHNNGKHAIWDIEDNVSIGKVSSVHHQMCAEPKPPGAKILAESSQSHTRWFNSLSKQEGTFIHEIEAYFLPHIGAIGFQGHPEYSGFEEYTMWCMRKINKHIVKNDTINLVGGQRRLNDVDKPSHKKVNKIAKMLDTG